MSLLRNLRNLALIGSLGYFAASFGKRFFGGSEQGGRALEGQVWNGRVTRVVDGDTVWADFGQGDIRVRFAHIDAPEHEQDGGAEAKAWLETVLGEDATIVAHPIETDYYGRVVADLHHNDSWLNYWLVRYGLAWALPADDATDIAEAQVAAQGEKKGIWADPYPTPPWVFRKEHAEAVPTANT
jgi:endonuclease YncB( thermonuclease family)